MVYLASTIVVGLFSVWLLIVLWNMKDVIGGLLVLLSIACFLLGTPALMIVVGIGDGSVGLAFLAGAAVSVAVGGVGGFLLWLGERDFYGFKGSHPTEASGTRDLAR